MEAERQIKWPPTEAALLAPAMFTAFAFEHAHGLACARIQLLTNEPGHRYFKGEWEELVMGGYLRYCSGRQGSGAYLEFQAET